MSSSLGNVAHCDTLIARELGSKSRPVETIHTASTFQFQNDLSFKDAEQTKLAVPHKTSRIRRSRSRRLKTTVGSSAPLCSGLRRFGFAR